MADHRSLLARDFTASGVLLFLALAEAVQVYVGLSLQEADVTWAGAVGATAPSWGVLLLLTIPLLRILDRPWASPLNPRKLPVFLVGAALFSGLHLAGSALLWSWVGTGGVGFRENFYSLTTLYFVPDVFTFVAVVTVHSVVRRQTEDRRREVEAVSKRAEDAQARFQILQGQLRPDFFFNTLNALAGLIARSDTSRSLDVLSSLSALLRASLTVEPGRPVRFEDELELASGYLAIQAIRFPDRVHGEWNGVDGVAQCTVPALCLVQLVEALVDLGLEDGYPFSIRIAGRVEAAVLKVDVTHSGPEIDEATREHLAQCIFSFDPSGRLLANEGGVTLELRARPAPRSDLTRGLEVAS